MLLTQAVERHKNSQPVGWLIWLEAAILAAAAPLLLFPTIRPAWTAFALGELALVWLLRWAVTCQPWPPSPFNRPLLLFALMVMLGSLVSDWPELTLPKTTGLILGLAAFRLTTLAVHSRRSLGAAIAVFCLLGLAIIGVGAVAAHWTAKVSGLGALARRIPRLITFLPGMPAAGINPNQIAGAPTLYLPPSLAIMVALLRNLVGRRSPDRALVGEGLLTEPSRLFFHFLLLAGSAAFLALIAAVLALTQSRSGWIGGTAGLLALGALAGLSDRRPAMRRLGLALALLPGAIILGGLLYLGPQRAGELVFGVESKPGLETLAGSVSMAGRLEIWNRAFHVIQAFSFAGCGLGTFRKVAPLLYPFLLHSPEAEIPHAHNIFLQTAVDIGLPGLAAYLALLMVAGEICWRWARPGSGFIRTVALGLAGGLVGLHVYGLTDALALGSKPALAFWLALGLVASLEQATRSRSEPVPSNQGAAADQLDPGQCKL